MRAFGRAATQGSVLQRQACRRRPPRRAGHPGWCSSTARHPPSALGAQIRRGRLGSGPQSAVSLLSFQTLLGNLAGQETPTAPPRDEDFRRPQSGSPQPGGDSVRTAPKQDTDLHTGKFTSMRGQETHTLVAPMTRCPESQVTVLETETEEQEPVPQFF